MATHSIRGPVCNSHISFSSGICRLQARRVKIIRLCCACFPKIVLSVSLGLALTTLESVFLTARTSGY